MKITIKNIVIKQENGDPQIDALTKKELNTANLISIMLDQSQFKGLIEHGKAYDILKKLKSGKDVELEDTEFSLVKQKLEEFTPYTRGFNFIEFVELFK